MIIISRVGAIPIIDVKKKLLPHDMGTIPVFGYVRPYIVL